MLIRTTANRIDIVGGEVLEFHHPDRLGTRMVTNPAADTLYLQSTLPFGTLLSSETTGSSNRLFTTYDRSSSTGLDYAVNRTYSPGQGRFTQVDPIQMSSASIGNPQSNNLYAYVQNNPITMVDPTGLDEACSFSGKVGSDGQLIYDGTIGADGRCHANFGEPVVIEAGYLDLPFNLNGTNIFPLPSGGAALPDGGTSSQTPIVEECPPGPTICTAEMGKSPRDKARERDARVAAEQALRWERFKECVRNGIQAITTQVQGQLIQTTGGVVASSIGDSSGVRRLIVLGTSYLVFQNNLPAYQQTENEVREKCRAETGYTGPIRDERPLFFKPALGRN